MDAKARQEKILELREKAEAVMESALADHGSPSNCESLTKAIHELQVYQVELELQNDELECANALSEELFAYAPVGYVVITRNGVIQKCNRAFSDLLGCDGDEVMGRALVSYISKESYWEYFDFHKNLSNYGVEAVCRLLLQSSTNDSCTPVQLVGRKMLHLNETDSSYLIGVIDLSFDVQITEVMKEKARLNQLLLDTQPLASLLRSREMTVLACNEKAREMGFVPGQFCFSSCPVSEGESPHTCDVCRNASREVSKGDDHVEKQFVAKDGSLHSVYIKYADEGLDFVSFRNVTDTYIEQARHDRMENVTRLANVAGSVAHDLNNAMAGIIGYVALLEQRTDQDEKAVRYVSQIKVSAARASSLIRKMMNLGKPEDETLSCLDLSATLREICERIRPLLSRMIEMELQLSGESAKIIAKESSLQTIFNNLILNAKDAIKSEGTIRIEDIPPDSSRHREGYVCIAVSDTGCGIRPDAQKKLFSPFFTTKGFDKGTGLGLPTVKNQLEECGGRIDYETSCHGTTFYVFLPKAECGTTDCCTPKPEAALPFIVSIAGSEVIEAVVQVHSREKGYRFASYSTIADYREKHNHSIARPVLFLLDAESIPPEEVCDFYPTRKGVRTLCLVTGDASDLATDDPHVHMIYKPLPIEKLLAWMPWKENSDATIE